MTHIHTKLPRLSNLMTQFGRFAPSLAFYGLRVDNPLKPHVKFTNIQQLLLVNCEHNSFYTIQPNMFPNLQSLYMFSPSMSWAENVYAMSYFSNRYNPLKTRMDVYFEYNPKNYEKFLRDKETDFLCPYVKFLEPLESRIIKNDVMSRKFVPIEDWYRKIE